MKIKSFLIASIISLISSFPIFPKIIVLNGPCCAGKYSIAEKMVKELNGVGQKWVHFSVKDCHKLIRENYSGDIKYYINVMHENIKAKAKMGINVIVDYVFSNEDVFKDWLFTLRELRDIKYVWVCCLQQTAGLRARELYQNSEQDFKLTSYSIGVHFYWYEKIKSFKQGLGYAYEIGTDDFSIDQCADQIIKALVCV